VTETNTTMESSASVKEAFDRDGYVILRGLFTPSEVAEMKAEAKRVLGDALTNRKPGDHGVYVGMAAKSEVFHNVAADSRLADALEAVIGPDIEFLSDKIVYKSADIGFASPWHQDWPYWEGRNKISVWIALDPATEENGCLKLMPGSHKALASHDGDSSDGHGFGYRLDQSTVDESKAVSAPCDAGDAVVFHDLTLHASHPNTSGRDRWTLISTYRSASEPDKEYDWAVAAFMVRGKKGF
jgi:phytanoyl-CoA hydroxylase